MNNLLRSAVALLLWNVLTTITVAQEDEPPSQVPGIKVGTFDAEIARSATIADGLPSNDALAVVLTGNGVVYCGTAQGLVRLEKGEWQRVSNYNGPVKLLAAQEKGVIALVAGSLLRCADAGNDVIETAVQVPETETLHMLSGGDPLLLATSNGLYELNESDKFVPVSSLNELEGDVRAVAVAADGRRAVAGRSGLFLQRGDERWQAVHPADGDRSWAPRDVRAVAFDSQDRLWFASPQGVGVQTNEGWRLFNGYDGLPYDDFTTMTAGEEGVVWFGTTKGGIRFDGSTWEYRQAPRWLPGELVRSIAVNNDGDAWFATPEGIGNIERKPMTLAEKAEFFEEEIDKYHRRTPYGYILSVRLKNPGDKSEWTQHDSDNDGLWTSMYGAGECFAYAATKDPQARQRATDAFEAVRFLSEVTQGGSHPAPPGFPARTILPTSGPDPNENPGYTVEGDRRRQERDPQWKIISPRWPVSEDGKWYWKTDTSSDELDGHYFLYALYYDLVAETEEEKQRVRDVVAAITDHLIEHDYALVDHDGKPTRWARFGPEALHSGDMIDQRPLNSLSVLSYLKTAEHVTGDKKYAEAYDSLLYDHGYKASILISKTQSGPGTGNQSDDEMAFMNYYNVLSYENDPELRRLYLISLYRYWQNERPELNPLFNFIFAAKFEGFRRYRLGVDPSVIAESVDTLKRYPLDRVRYAFDNTHRTDIVLMSSFSRRGRNEKGHRRDGTVIPIDERSVEHWNHDPWELKGGGDGRSLTDGAAFLLPYYMGLYHGFIIETDR